MRFALVVVCLSLPGFRALADDVRPPAISEVSASRKGHKVEVRALITDETGVLSATCHHRDKGGSWEAASMRKGSMDDVFRASFNGGTETEYWIEAIDLLGNGPATWGTVSTPMAVGGGAKADAGSDASSRSAARKNARPSGPVVQYRKPAGEALAGQEFAVRARIRGDSHNKSCLWRRLLFRSAGFGSGIGVLLGEALDATCGVDQLLLAGEERMATGTNFYAQHIAFHGRARRKCWKR